MGVLFHVVHHLLLSLSLCFFVVSSIRWKYIAVCCSFFKTQFIVLLVVDRFRASKAVPNPSS